MGRPPAIDNPRRLNVPQKPPQRPPQINLPGVEFTSSGARRWPARRWRPPGQVLGCSGTSPAKKGGRVVRQEEQGHLYVSIALSIGQVLGCSGTSPAQREGVWSGGTGTYLSIYRSVYHSCDLSVYLTIYIPARRRRSIFLSDIYIYIYTHNYKYG